MNESTTPIQFDLPTLESMPDREAIEQVLLAVYRTLPGNEELERIPSENVDLALAICEELAQETSLSPVAALLAVLKNDPSRFFDSYRLRTLDFFPDKWEIVISGAPPPIYPEHAWKEGGFEYIRDENALIYRGPWVLDPIAVRRISLYSIFFSKVFVSSFTVIPENVNGSHEVLEDIAALCRLGYVEPFHVNYHSYMDNICTAHFGESQVAIDHLVGSAHREYAIPYRTKFYPIPSRQDVNGKIPLLATAYDLQDDDYVQLLQSVRNKLSEIRFGPYSDFYKEMWPRLVQYLQQSIETLPAPERDMLEEARNRLPITVIDYAYYINLTLHWLSVFGATGFGCDPAELEIYRYRLMREDNSQPAPTSGRIVEAFFSIPFFPQFARIRVDQIYRLRQLPEIQSWRAHLRNIASHVVSGSHVSSNGDHVRTSPEFNAVSDDLWNRFGEIAYSARDMKGIARKGLRDSGITVGGWAYPPLSALGFLGTAREFYRGFNFDPIMAFSLSAREILGSA
jgi:hypothetical protein